MGICICMPTTIIYCAGVTTSEAIGSLRDILDTDRSQEKCHRSIQLFIWCWKNKKTKNRLVTATFLSVWEKLVVHTCCSWMPSQWKVDTVCHAALRFITNYVIVMCLLELMATSVHHTQTTAPLHLQTNYMEERRLFWVALKSLHLLSVPFGCMEIGKRAFVCAAPSAWNVSQNDWNLTELVSLNAFISRRRTL